ncbi:hypothetical protein BH23ACT10_BH23ACT10_16240 [soil metagenome]
MYTPATVERLRLAKALQAHGFTLDEVIDALHACDAGSTCVHERWRLEGLLARIDRQRGVLRGRVADTLAACEAGTCGLTM